VLAINVWKEPEVSRSGPVRSDGKISLPLVGELTAGGQTPLQLEVTPHVAQNRSKSHHSFFRTLLVGITASAHSSGQTFES